MISTESRYLIGIDLGTTNSAVAYVDTHEVTRGEPRIHPLTIPQLVAEREVAAMPTLPSFLYLAEPLETASGDLRLPWDEQPAWIAGVLARERGALTPGRQIASAKSWLCHPAVDRTAKILPWGAESGEETCSPVDASARFLSHLRSAWNHAFSAGDPEHEARFERQDVVITLPASFDEEARELTVRAARDAGLVHVTLLEEPLAAFYAWISANHRSLRRRLKHADLVLICDVGGGTTDFSLIRVQIVDSQIQFERTAIGEHLLLGGDNLDLALARRVEERLGVAKLSIRQRNALRRQCCAAKERILSDPGVERVTITVLGSGRSLVGGLLAAELVREDVESALLDGFLPSTQHDELPARERQTGFRELGLPYAHEPAITKHLAEFLTRSATSDESARRIGPCASPSSMVRPDAILFNGGFFTPEIARERLAEQIAHWFRDPGKRWKPKVLTNDSPEAAVAVGAAYYGRVRRGGGIRIGGGIARTYYVGVQAGVRADEGRQKAVCILPRGTEEGTTLPLEDRDFMVLANRPVTFSLFSSTTRHAAHGDLCLLSDDEVHSHSPLVTVLRYGKKTNLTELAVQLTVTFTEMGTLELWCESKSTPHRWRLQFQVRSVEADEEPQVGEPEEAETLIPADAIEAAERSIRAVFGNPDEAIPGEPSIPETLGTRLEAVLGYGKDAWPIGTIRVLCDVLADVAEGRKKSPRHEARWLNLFGYCLRPGFGAVLDDWRVGRARNIYLSGIGFPNDVQCQVEWLVLLQRIAGGFTAGQQREVLQRHLALLGAGGKKRKSRLNPQVEREGWKLLASLEQIPSAERAALGQELLERFEGGHVHKSYLWSLGRFGARIPFHGPLNGVVPPDVASLWIEKLLGVRDCTPEIASTVVQVGAYAGDHDRDVDASLRDRAVARLRAFGYGDETVGPLVRYIPPARSNASRIFGESLPEGLRLLEEGGLSSRD